MLIYYFVALFYRFLPEYVLVKAICKSAFPMEAYSLIQLDYTYDAASSQNSFDNDLRENHEKGL
jgi:hypothetical protein